MELISPNVVGFEANYDIVVEFRPLVSAAIM